MADIIHFPVIARPIPAADAQPSPEYLRGWLPFLAVVESDYGEEALPIRGRAEDEGPAIVFNPALVSPEDMEDSSIAVMWLSPCLMQVAGTVLAEALAAEDGIGRFRSGRWIAFRNAVEKATGQEWSGEENEKGVTKTVLGVALRQGLDFAADHIVASLLIESKLYDYLETTA